MTNMIKDKRNHIIGLKWLLTLSPISCFLFVVEDMDFSISAFAISYAHIYNNNFLWKP